MAMLSESRSAGKDLTFLTIFIATTCSESFPRHLKPIQIKGMVIILDSDPCPLLSPPVRAK